MRAGNQPLFEHDHIKMRAGNRQPLFERDRIKNES